MDYFGYLSLPKGDRERERGVLCCALYMYVSVSVCVCVWWVDGVFGGWGEEVLVIIIGLSP